MNTHLEFILFYMENVFPLDIFYLVRLRVKENNLIASQKIRDIYQNNKKEFFLSYFLLLRKIFQMLEQSKVFDKEVYLLLKKNKENCFNKN